MRAAEEARSPAAVETEGSTRRRPSSIDEMREHTEGSAPPSPPLATATSPFTPVAAPPVFGSPLGSTPTNQGPYKGTPQVPCFVFTLPHRGWAAGQEHQRTDRPFARSGQSSRVR